MKQEAEVPIEGKGNAPDREAEVPQAAAAASRPTVESPPVREDRRAKNPVDTQEKGEKPGSPMLPSTRTMMGICGIPRRPRREHQLRSLEGACTIMRTRPRAGAEIRGG